MSYRIAGVVGAFATIADTALAAATPVTPQPGAGDRAGGGDGFGVKSP